MSERKSGFGPGFAKDVEAILSTFYGGHIYHSEVRKNLRRAGMELDETAPEMPDFAVIPTEDPYEPEEEPVDE